MGGGSLACVMLCCVPSRRRRVRSILGMLLLLISLSSGMLACGGAGSVSGGTSNPGTTAGTYTVAVTGTSGTITEVSPVTLTAQ